MINDMAEAESTQKPGYLSILDLMTWGNLNRHRGLATCSGFNPSVTH